MKVDYSKYPEIPKGCQLNYNKARNVYQVFREHRVTDPASGKRKTHRQTIGQIKDGIFSFSKLWLERKKNEALQAKLNGFSPDNTVPATQTAKKIRSSLEAAECEQRDERRIVFPLEPIAQAAVMSALSGATDCSEIAMFYNDHKDLFGTLYDHLPEFPLSADTVYRAFMKIEPGRFEVFYEQLLSHLLSLSPTNPQVMDGNGRTIRVISADGQAIRATSKNKGSSRIHDYHMLMNFYDINKRICLKQKLIDKKTNEISVGPSMLQNLDITGSVVTADAMSCQMRFVEAVLDGGADYCISLKGNQERSWEEVRLLFATTHPDQILNLPSSVELDHGRIEQRTIEIIRGSLLSTVLRDKWRGMDKGCVIKVTSSRQYKKAGQSQNEERYYISSLLSLTPMN